MVPVDDETDEPVDDLPTETVPQDEIDAMMTSMSDGDDDLPTEVAPADEIRAYVAGARADTGGADEIPTARMPLGRALPTGPPGATDDPPTDVEDLDDLPTGILPQPLPPPPEAGGRAPRPPSEPPIGPMAGPIQLPLAPDELEVTHMVAIDEDAAPAYDPDFDDSVADLTPPPPPAPQQVTPTPNDTARMPRQGGRLGWLIAAALIAGGLVGGWFIMKRDNRKQSAAVAAPPTDATPPETGAVTIEPIAPSPTPTATSLTDAGPVPGEPFTVSLARRQTAIDGCVSEHPRDVGDGLKVTFVLPIARDGTAPGAGIRPARVARTELGKCLRDVARRTRFARQAKPVSVSIPLTVRPR